MIICSILGNSILIISAIIMLINNFTSMKSIIDREKNSPFECGFDPKSSPRIPFSINFFLIGIIFLIFDIEIALLLPLIFVMKISNPMNFILVSTLFIMVLIMGIFHEWNQGALNWMF
uniref:NADH-ubiquinone oxidoreductase chain 3 n=1 Tax=Lucidina sp. FM13 TaxID=2596686 RepID=A0A5C0PYP2_9COLE|nr:NADH dehydrogenase subunit 3 [Lucidina sp. FM13]